MQDALSEKLACFLREGFTREDFKLIVRRQPKVMKFPFEGNFRGKLQLLQLQGYPGQPLSRAEVRELVTKFPGCLTLSTENIVAKLDYLVHVLGRDAHELLRCPAYLTIGSERRIVPRSSYVKVLGAHQNLSLNSIVKPADAQLCKLLNVTVEHYEAFRVSKRLEAFS